MGIMLKDKVIAIAERQGFDETAAEKESLRAFNELMRCKETQSFLTGSIIKVARLTNMSERFSEAVMISYKGYRVFIPLFDMGFPLVNTGLYKMYARAMLGSVIDFKIVGVDKDKKVAIASRSEAMRIKREKFYLSDEGIIRRAFEESIPVEARVVALSPSSVRVEIFGVDTKIHMKELSNRYISEEDMRKQFYPGAIIKVKIITLEIDDITKDIVLTASARAAYPDDTGERIKLYNIGDAVTGVVTRVTERGYFVSIGDWETGIDIFCAKLDCFETPSGGDIVRCTIGLIDSSVNRVFGRINAVIRRDAA